MSERGGATASVQRPDGGDARMFDAIADRYDLLNRLLSLGIDGLWRRRAAESLAIEGGARVLDVACGTGDMLLALHEVAPAVRLVGVDPAHRMLEMARRKLRRRGLFEDQVELVAGDAQELPFGDESFDAATMAFGIRNVPDRSRALSELLRVVRKGGRLAILELGTPRRGWLALPARLYVRRLVPLVGGLLSRGSAYSYLTKSIDAFPEPPAFSARMGEAGWRDLRWESLTMGAACLYTGVRP